MKKLGQKSRKYTTIEVPPFAMRKKECLIDDLTEACRDNNAYEGYVVSTFLKAEGTRKYSSFTFTHSL